LRQDLVAMLSHDLKKPVDGGPRLRGDPPRAPTEDAQRDEFLARIEANAHGGAQLAINFVDASQIESGAISNRGSSQSS